MREKNVCLRNAPTTEKEPCGVSIRLRRRFLQETVKQVKQEAYFIAKFRNKKSLFLFTGKVYNAKKHCQVKAEKSL